MADNREELRLTGPFYCHNCDMEIPSCTLDYTCTICNGGFIEPASSVPMDTNMHHLPSIFQNQTDDEDDEDEEDDDDDLEPHISRSSADAPVSIAISHRGNHHPLRRGGRRTRISIHRLQANNAENNNFFQNFLQQFLQGLMGSNNNTTTRGLNVNPFIFNSNDFVWTRGGLDNIITMFMNQLDNTGPPPAGKDTIDALPSIRVPQHFIAEKMQCHVCMEDFVLDEEVKQLACKHVYHQDCITPWLELHGTCPICRKVVDGGTNPSTSTPPLSTATQSPPQPAQSSQQTFREDASTNIANNSSTDHELNQSSYVDQMNLD